MGRGRKGGWVLRVGTYFMSVVILCLGREEGARRRLLLACDDGVCWEGPKTGKVRTGQPTAHATMPVLVLVAVVEAITL